MPAHTILNDEDHHNKNNACIDDGSHYLASYKLIILACEPQTTSGTYNVTSLLGFVSYPIIVIIVYRIPKTTNKK